MTPAAVADRIYAESRAPNASGDGDAQLIRRIREGDSAAFEHLMATYQGGVYGIILRLVDDAEEARDITQETFLRVYQKIDQFREESSLRTWIYRIAIRQASNHRRWWSRHGGYRTISIDAPWLSDTRALREALSDRRADSEEVLLRRERQRHLAEALGRIKRRYRAAVILRDIEGCSYEDIARILGVTLGTVKSRIARGREQLRQELVKHYPGVLDH